MATYPEIDFRFGRTLDVTGFDLGADSGSECGGITVGCELAGVAMGQWNVVNNIIGIATRTASGARAFLIAPATRENLMALWNSDLKENQNLNVPFSTGRAPLDPAAAFRLAQFRQQVAIDVAMEMVAIEPALDAAGF